MALVNELEAQGNWLFRWRSYLPFLLIVLIAVAFRHFDYPFHSYFVHEVWEQACLTVSLVGLLIRGLTIGYTPARTSGRNTEGQIADELNTTGIYSIVRHPLYLGNFLIGLGISLVQMVWWLPVIYTLAFWVYYERIMFAEESFLLNKFGDEYRRWASATPAFWPRFSQWRKPPLLFSFRNVLRREYTGLMIVVLGHAGVEFSEHLVMDHRVVYEVFWVLFIAIGVTTYFVLRTLNRRTELLKVPGR
jgi:protein-S-isoprenylcysteine O-methyltransferase Ste14